MATEPCCAATASETDVGLICGANVAFSSSSSLARSACRFSSFLRCSSSRRSCSGRSAASFARKLDVGLMCGAKLWWAR